MTFNQTQMNPFALIILLASAVVIFSKKDWVFTAIFLPGVFLSLQQRVVLGSLDFTIIRLLVIAGIFRAIIKGEHKQIDYDGLSKTLIFYCLSMVVANTVLFKTMGAFVNRAGWALDILGIFLLVRIYLKDEEAIIRFLKSLNVLVLIFAVFTIFEFFTGRNFLSIFGGVPEFAYVREGRIRCQSSFQHPISSGTFGASIFFINLGLKNYYQRSKGWFRTGFIGCLIMVILSSSSGPVLSFGFGVVGLFLWKYKEYLRQVRALILLGILGLALVMKAPVYAIIGRMAVFGASTGYHRYMLIDNFVRTVNEWWFTGIKSTDHWVGLANPRDITNHFIRIGIDGGIFALFLFLLVIYFAFKYVGGILKSDDVSEKFKFLSYNFGVALLVHCSALFSISYFDQINFLLFATIGIIGNLHRIALEKPR